MNYHIDKKIEIVNDEFGVAYTFATIDEYGTISLTDNSDSDIALRTIFITQDALQHVIDVLIELKSSSKVD